jgi:integrase
MVMTEEVEDPIANLLYGLKASESRRQYPRRFKMVLDFMNLKGTLNEQAIQFLMLVKQSPETIEDNLKRFITFQIQRAVHGEIVEATISNYYKAVKLFCEMNRVSSVINWKILSRGLPRGRQAVNDRAPTVEELKRLVEYPDRRIKAIVYVMVSSGIRLGAWDSLKWIHVVPIENDDGAPLAARLVVYPGDREEYYTFISGEALFALNEWMEFRASYGEQISGDSWLMRDLWQTSNVDLHSKHGLATCPKKLKSSGIKRLLERALWEQGIRSVLPPGVKRHEWKAAHGLRKYYKSHAEQGMRAINVEKTMGHDIGISESYYKPTEKEVAEDYLKAVDLLTINANTAILQKQAARMSEQSEREKSTMEEKHRLEMSKLEEKMEQNSQVFSKLSDQVRTIMNEISYMKSSKSLRAVRDVIQEGLVNSKQ